MSKLAVGSQLGLGLENLTATKMNYLLSQDASHENCKFVQLDHQIIVIGWAYIYCQVRKTIHGKSWLFPHIYFAVWNS